MPVAELVERVTWAEFLHWVVFFAWEHEQSLPRERRPIRPADKTEAIHALNCAFGVGAETPKRARKK